jgi:2-dehydro-3-deoxyphosphogluconate aldolase/(4S)-4-hydroxy-2-oxoglutarate aldolase
MIETGMVPVFYNADTEVAKKVAAAVFSGGCPFLEFTKRGHHA